MPAPDEAVFLAEHRMPVPRPVLDEIGKKLTVAPLFVDASPGVFARAAANKRRCVLKDAPDWRLKGHIGLRKSLRGFLSAIDPRKIGLACGLTVVRFKNAEERPGRAFSWL